MTNPHQFLDPAKTVTELLRQETPVTFRAGGPSMNPTIRDGDSVRIEPVHSGSIRRGSVILFHHHQRLVLHRVIRRQRHTGQWFIVGDAALNGGDWASTDQVLGIAKWVDRSGSTIRLDCALRRWAGLLRFYVRPLRRILTALYQRHHTATPEN